MAGTSPAMTKVKVAGTKPGHDGKAVAGSAGEKVNAALSSVMPGLVPGIPTGLALP
jgi:hypothetical protein